MKCWVDTSGLFALLDRDAEDHGEASRVWRSASADEVEFVTSSYVLVEANALVQRRLGMDALRDLAGRVLPLAEVVWVDEGVHARALTQLLAENRRQLSLVDCVSFVLMRDLGITRAFAFDKHYEERGFALP